MSQKDSHPLNPIPVLLNQNQVSHFYFLTIKGNILNRNRKREEEEEKEEIEKKKSHDQITRDEKSPATKNR